MKNRVAVALTGLAGLDNPEPGLGVARALRNRWGRAIVMEGLVYDPWSTGGWTPGIVDRLHLIPPVASGDDAVLRRMLDVHKAHPVDVLIPCLDLEVPVYSRLAGRLGREGIHTLLPAPEDIAAVTKVNLHAFCYARDILTPHTIHVRDVSAVALHADHFGYPLWVKGTVAGAKKVYNRAQAMYEAEVLAAKWGGGVLLQEAVEGNEHIVAMVARSDGSCLAMAAARKLARNERGKSAIGAIIDDPALKRLATDILAKLHWRGPLELEFVRSAANGRYYLLEINCRFPSWILLTDFAGGNLPAALVQEILKPGGRAPRGSAVGSMYARDVQEYVVPLDSIMQLKRIATASVPGPAIRTSRRGDIAVGVTGISAVELTQPGLGVARCLQSAPEVGRVIGLAYTPNDTGIFRTGLFDVCCRIPFGPDADKDIDVDGDAELFDTLRAIRKKHGLDVIIPNLDIEIPRFRRLASQLEGVGIHTLLPSTGAIRKLSKMGLADLSLHHGLEGLEFPQTMLIRSQRDLDAAWKRFGMPLILKGMHARALRTYSPEQARLGWLHFRQEGEATIMAQQAILGEEYGIGIVCGRDGRLIDAMPLKKLVMCERSKTWAAISTPLPQLIAQLGDLLSRVGWVGPADVEFIRDGVSDRMVLIEINPRFPAWIGFSEMVDINLPRQLVLSALDQAPAPGTTEKSRLPEAVFMRTTEEITATATAMAAFVNRGEVSHGR